MGKADVERHISTPMHVSNAKATKSQSTLTFHSVYCIHIFQHCKNKTAFRLNLDPAGTLFSILKGASTLL